MDSTVGPRGRVARLLDATQPASGAVVMGTGIVSVALLLDGQRVLSAVLLVLCGLIWLALAGLLPVRALVDPDRFAVERAQPGALTAVAGTAVLGARLTLDGWSWAGATLLVVALASWFGLVPYVLRHWQTPTIGTSFLLAVATESLGLLAATVSVADRAGWLLYAALVPFALGLCFYALVVSRFQFRQLAVGLGDHWVTGGALAISTMAAAQITAAAQRTAGLSGGHEALKTIALVLWCLSMAWLPALILAETLRPRLAYDVQRWATVFPFGMYAACSFWVGTVTGIGGISDFARGWVWAAFAVWLVVLAGMGRRAPAPISGDPGPAT